MKVSVSTEYQTELFWTPQSWKEPYGTNFRSHCLQLYRWTCDMV